MATLEQIQAKMDKLKAQAESLAAKKAQVIVDKIRGLMLAHGLTTKDIEADAKTKRAAKAVNGSAVKAANVSKKSAGKVAAKYLDPKSGATWTGRGRAPAWIARAKDRSKFLIGAAAEVVVASKQAGAAKTKSKANAAVAKQAAARAVTARKGPPKGEPLAKYRDPKSGATWGGRGRAPLWIAGAKDRSKFLIDGAQAATPVAPVAKTGKPKATVTKAAKPVTKTAKPKAAVTKVSKPVAKTTEPKATVTKAAKPAAKASEPKATVKKSVATKPATTKAPVAKKVDAAKPTVVEKSPAAGEKIAVKKPVVSTAKPKAPKNTAPKNTAPKNTAPKNTAEVEVVVANADVPTAPEASVQVAV